MFNIMIQTTLPDPLIEQINSYFFNNETIRQAVKEYMENEEQAIQKYGHINTWDTSGVTDMSNLFKNAFKFNQPIGNWNTSNVTNMSGMFCEAHFFNQPINNWDTSNVTDMSKLFHYAYYFNQPLNNWDTSNVINMSHMFCAAHSFNQCLKSWDISKATNMERMFCEARKFDEDNIDGWNLANKNIDYIFYDGMVSYGPIELGDDDYMIIK